MAAASGMELPLLSGLICFRTGTALLHAGRY